MSVPHNIVIGVADIYLAPLAEAYPDVDEAPAGNWAQIGSGSSGSSKNASEDGVSVEFTEETTDHYVDGETGPVKSTRTRESGLITCMIYDLTPAQLTKIIQGTAPTSVAAGAGTPGYDWIGLYKGVSVQELSLLVRGEGISPQNDGTASWSLQWEVPRVVTKGGISVVHSKSGKAGINFQFGILIDFTAATDAEKFGRFISQDATAV